MDKTVQSVSAVLGLAAFTLGVVSGLAAANPPFDVLKRAAIAMVAAHAVGYLLGLAGTRAVRERIDRHIRSNPIPERTTGVPPEAAPTDSKEPGPVQGSAA